MKTEGSVFFANSQKVNSDRLNPVNVNVACLRPFDPDEQVGVSNPYNPRQTRQRIHQDFLPLLGRGRPLFGVARAAVSDRQSEHHSPQHQASDDRKHRFHSVLQFGNSLVYRGRYTGVNR